MESDDPMLGSDFDRYQDQAIATAIYPDVGKNLVYPTLGIAGEAGEFAEKVKKFIRDGTFDRAAMGKELGDVLWYIATAAYELGFKLSEIVVMNEAKLQKRWSSGTVGGSGDER